LFSLFAATTNIAANDITQSDIDNFGSTHLNKPNVAVISAAANGNVLDQYELGRRLAEGVNGFPKNPSAALAWLNRAKKRGYPGAVSLDGLPKFPLQARFAGSIADTNFPDANIDVIQPYSAENQNAQFSAFNSSDNATIVHYFWYVSDADGNQIFNGNALLAGTEQEFQPTLSVPGTYYINLVVMDSSGWTSPESIEFVVPETAPPETPADLVPSAIFPALDNDGNINWSFEAKYSGLEVHIQPYTELPLATKGTPARWNGFSSIDNRIFIVDEQDGHVYEITNAQSPQLWFDISSAIQSHTGRELDTSNLFHGGVRGIAFHPDFLNNGKFYASIMEERPTDTSSHFYISDDSGISADSVLVEWTADPATFAMDISSYREVFRVGVPEYDHPIKQIAFNPHATPEDSDYGHLYIAHGDGSIESTLAGSGHNNDALGKILRIDPLESGDENYTMPADNPFLYDASIPSEVFSYGHRNPHHLAFTADGHLLATEAGRDNVDEINLVTSGSDYGWSEREGAFVHLDQGTVLNGIDALPANDAFNGYVYPAVQFGHHSAAGSTFTAVALGGGYVVENNSDIAGEFFFIDFPKTGDLLHASLSDILAANTTGDPATLTGAQAYIATVKFDHDSDPNTPALDNTIKEVIQSATGYVNTSDRLDVRIFQGPEGELYLSSKRNNRVYLVTSSLPND